MTKRTKKTIILILMLLTVCLYFISTTYARYTSEVTANAKTTVAKWAVQFKNGDAEFTNGETLQFQVKENANVVSGRIAPATEATATIKVDLTGTEVAVDCLASVNKDSLAGIFGASADSVTVLTSVNGAEASETTTIALPNGAAFTAGNGVVEITITLKWVNNDNKNVSDTAAGVAASDITLPVTVTMQQHI